MLRFFIRGCLHDQIHNYGSKKLPPVVGSLCCLYAFLRRQMRWMPTVLALEFFQESLAKPWYFEILKKLQGKRPCFRVHLAILGSITKMPAPGDYTGRFENFKAPSHVFCLPRGNFFCDCWKFNAGIQLFLNNFWGCREKDRARTAPAWSGISQCSP